MARTVIMDVCMTAADALRISQIRSAEGWSLSRRLGDVGLASVNKQSNNAEQLLTAQPADAAEKITVLVWRKG